ncbi:MAG: arylformamidase [Longimicrobiales bacterium]
MRIRDISQRVANDTAVWPGDQPCSTRWTMRREDGNPVNVAALSMSAHTGTHVDGPFHFADDGERPAQLRLDAFIGPATVVDARGRDRLDVDALAAVDIERTQRLLFRTRDAVDERVFPTAFAAFTPALARRMGEAGIRLVGTDAPSVDPFESKTLEAHRILAQRGIAIVENLVLENIEAGTYTLIALPLKLADADSSPVRAVLIDDRIVP